MTNHTLKQQHLATQDRLTDVPALNSTIPCCQNKHSHSLWDKDQACITDFETSCSSLNHEQARLIAQQEQQLELPQVHTSLFPNIITIHPPKTIAELLLACEALAGLTVAQVCERCNIPVIASLQLNKGWLGNLVEVALGASAGSKPTQDFINLGIELKTVAINAQGKVQNDIFVSTIPWQTFMIQDWQHSHAFYKLQHILFVPVEANANLPLAQRHLGMGVLWKPSPEQLQVLQQDWQQIMQLIADQDYGSLHANVGTYLCVRIKALNSRQFNTTYDSDGYQTRLPPLSFYLRKSFVNQIFQQLYH